MVSIAGLYGAGFNQNPEDGGGGRSIFGFRGARGAPGSRGVEGPTASEQVAHQQKALQAEQDAEHKALLELNKNM